MQAYPFSEEQAGLGKWFGPDSILSLSITSNLRHITFIFQALKGKVLGSFQCDIRNGGPVSQ